MAPKKHLVTLKVQTEFLKTLPAIAPPKPKRVKKVAAEDKKGAAGTNGSASVSKGTSPALNEEPASHRINTGPKEMSTAGLTVNSVNQTLDKSGTPCKKWGRTTRQFKTFSGFKVKIKTWRHKPESKVKHERKPSVSGVEQPEAPAAPTSPSAPAAPATVTA